MCAISDPLPLTAMLEKTAESTQAQVHRAMVQISANFPPNHGQRSQHKQAQSRAQSERETVVRGDVTEEGGIGVPSDSFLDMPPVIP